MEVDPPRVTTPSVSAKPATLQPAEVAPARPTQPTQPNQPVQSFQPIASPIVQTPAPPAQPAQPAAQPSLDLGNLDLTSLLASYGVQGAGKLVLICCMFG